VGSIITIQQLLATWKIWRLPQLGWRAKSICHLA